MGNNAERQEISTHSFPCLFFLSLLASFVSNKKQTECFFEFWGPSFLKRKHSMSLSSQPPLFTKASTYELPISDPGDQSHRLAFLTSWHIRNLPLSAMSFYLDVAPCTFLHLCLLCYQPSSSLPISLLRLQSPTGTHTRTHAHKHTHSIAGGGYFICPYYYHVRYS